MLYQNVFKLHERPSEEASVRNSSLTKNFEPIDPSEYLTELSGLVYSTYLSVFHSQRKFVSWRLCCLVCFLKLDVSKVTVGE